jgi:hypothetical protein
MSEASNTKTRFLVALGSDAREFALLWLVFSLLDVFVKDDLTLRWLVGNMIFSTALWVLGAYIEIVRKKET